MSASGVSYFSMIGYLGGSLRIKKKKKKATGIAFGSQEIDGKNLLQNILYVLDTEHQVDLGWKHLPCWLVLIVLEGAM